MPLERPQAESLLEALVSLLRTTRTISHRAADISVSATPITVLRLVRDTDPRLGDLADQLHVKPSVASRAVAALEQSGYVSRAPDPDDARACRVVITDAGRDHLTERESKVLERLAETFADWTADEAEQSVRVLTRLESSVQEWVARIDADRTDEDIRPDQRPSPAQPDRQDAQDQQGRHRTKPQDQLRIDREKTTV